MSNSLVINSSPSEVRVALLENDVPCEVYIERQGDRGVVGNVYRGKVVRVLPGRQAAFVENGLDRTGFLYVNDALPMALSAEADEDDEPDKRRRGDDEEPEVGSPRERRPNRTQPAANIADVL
jgi:ribonuclease G